MARVTLAFQSLTVDRGTLVALDTDGRAWSLNPHDGRPWQPLTDQGEIPDPVPAPAATKKTPRA